MYSYGPPHMAVQKHDDQHEYTFSNYVRIRDFVQKTYLRRWTIGEKVAREGQGYPCYQHDMMMMMMMTPLRSRREERKSVWKISQLLQLTEIKLRDGRESRPQNQMLSFSFSLEVLTHACLLVLSSQLCCGVGPLHRANSKCVPTFSAVSHHLGLSPNWLSFLVIYPTSTLTALSYEFF